PTAHPDRLGRRSERREIPAEPHASPPGAPRRPAPTPRRAPYHGRVDAPRAAGCAARPLNGTAPDRPHTRPRISRRGNAFHDTRGQAPGLRPTPVRGHSETKF